MHIALLVALVAGAGVSLQSYVNGRLGEALGSAHTAAALNNCVGFAVLLVLTAATGAGRRGRIALRERREGPLRPWYLAGGLCGALLVATAAAVALEVGVALLTVALVLGQTAGSLGVDGVGLSPAGRRPLTAGRVAGVALAVAAVVVAALGASGDVRIGLLVLAVVAGAATAVQQAANGHLKRVTGEALVAGSINFAVGATALVVVALLVTGASPPNGYGAASPELWIGGFLGAFSATTAALTVRALGALRLTLAVVAGQSVASLAIDLVAPVRGESVGVADVVGVLLAVAAVGASLVRPHRDPATVAAG